MVIRNLDNVIKESYKRGLVDEKLVMEAVEKTFGGSCEKASRREDMFEHIDFWWDSPRKGRLGIDVKGVKKNNRKDSRYDDKIHWLELQNVNGNPGWLYGKAEYIAFMTFSKILFVRREKLLSFALECIKDKAVVYDTPYNCYVPYKRKKWGRDDLSFKVYTSDLENIAEFCIDCA